MKNDRQVSFSGGFRGPSDRRPPRRRADSPSWKVRIMFVLIGVLIFGTPHLVKLLAK